MDYQTKIIDSYSQDDMELYENIAKLTKSINDTYPKYDQWLFRKFFPELKTGKRKIIMAYVKENNPIAVALLKDTDEEKKICCLYVKEDYRSYGIARHLMKRSCEVLGTDCPFATVSDKNLPQLQGILDEMGFKFSYRKKGAYQSENTEYYFNNKAIEILKNDILSPLLLRSKNNSK